MSGDPADCLTAAQVELAVRGENDGIATESDVLDYFQNIACSEREYRLLAGATHAVCWGNQRLIAWEAIAGFFEADQLHS